MATIPSNFNFPTSKQIPDHAILDYYNKQTYLGNQFLLSSVSILGNTNEVASYLLTNSSSNTKSLFQNIKKVTCLSAGGVATFRFYLNPIINTNGIQAISFKADSSGSLNDKYFNLYDAQGNAFYVWFNINAAGTDPAVPGATGIEVSGATGASATTLGAAAAIAIAAANSTLSFTAHNASGVVSVTMVAAGTFQPATDSASATATTFTFAVTGGLGNPSTAINLRPASSNTSTAIAYTPGNFGVSANGTYIATLISSGQLPDVSQVLTILDPGQSLMVTVQMNESEGFTNTIEMGWYEL